MDQDPSEDAALRALLGTSSFGKQSRAANTEAQIELSKRKPAASKIALSYASSDEGSVRSGDEDEKDEDEDEDEDDDDDEEDEDEFPVSHELVLKTHERPVTSLTVDPSGARLVSGSTDCTFKMHDFSSMTPTTLRAFRSVDPSETKTSASSEAHPIHQVLFNPLSPSQMLVINALPQAKIFSRDGEMLIEFVKGDPYLRDMHNTKGHVSEVTSGAWHPTNRDLCVTGGTDSTLRIWDVNNKRAQKEVIVFKSKVLGTAGRSRITSVAWGAPAQGGSNVLVAAALDGTLVIYSGEGPHHRPAAEVRDAHTRDTWTSGVAISRDGNLVVSRGGDDTVKLWDTRKFKQPITTQSYPSISSQYPTANIQFSPSSANIIMGSETGHLHILNPATLKPDHSTPVTPGSQLISVLWHEKMNQIITGSANGEVHVLYNPTMSTGGAKLVMSKAPKRRHIDDDPNRTMDLSQGISGDSIMTPGGILTNSNQSSFAARHPTIGLTATGRSRDPRRPHMPFTGPFSKNGPATEEHIRKSIPLSSMREEDPREALLKYADKAKNDPIFTAAWKDTQPKTIYADVSDEEEAPDAKKQKR
jgi:WD40 repeat protein